jgi:hypothetical protein
MNILITVSLGLFLIIPTSTCPVPKYKRAAAKFILGATSAVSAAVILYNITKTAQRRLANPDYSKSKSFGAVTAQVVTILLHNKLLCTFLAASFAATGITMYSASQDLKSDAQEL